MSKKQTKRGGRATPPLGMGVVGTGLMGRIHATCYSELDELELVAVQSRTKDKAAALAKDVGGKVYDTYEGMLEDPRVEAVCVATPQSVHAEQIIAAANAGKHIFTEKPLALSPEELDAIEQAVNDAGVTLMVGHQLRFHPVTSIVRQHMAELGRVFALELEWPLLIKGAGGRCWERFRDGGFFMELGCHAVDLARFIMGEVVHVSAQTLRLNPDRVTEDHTHCVLRFANNTMATITVSANYRNQRQGLLIGRLLGEKGRIDFTIYPYRATFNEAHLVIDRGESIFVPDVTTQKLRVSPPASRFKTFAGFFDVYHQLAVSFARAVRNGEPPVCTLHDGREAVEIVLAAYDEQAKASETPNRARRRDQLRNDASSHPLVGE